MAEDKVSALISKTNGRLLLAIKPLEMFGRNMPTTATRVHHTPNSLVVVGAKRKGFHFQTNSILLIPLSLFSLLCPVNCFHSLGAKRLGHRSEVENEFHMILRANLVIYQRPIS